MHDSNATRRGGVNRRSVRSSIQFRFSAIFLVLIVLVFGFVLSAVNKPPQANDDTVSTDENTSIGIDVTANDADSDGTVDKTTVTITKDPKDGSLSVDLTTGVVTYTPDPGTCGSDVFKYTVQDNEGATSNGGRVDVTVICNEPPEARDDAETTDVNVSVGIAVTANDNDRDGTVNQSTVTITKDPKDGSLSVDPTTGVVTYTPDSDTCGRDYFEYTVQDNDGATSNEGRVDVTVICNEPPEANDDTASTDENTSIGIDVTANDSDPDGTIDKSTVNVTKDPKGGSLSVHPTIGVITYTPDPDTCGSDVFKYTIGDNDGATSEEATVTVDVLCNDPPLAIDDLYSMSEGETLTIRRPGILSNDVDTPGSPLTAIQVSDVAHGTLSLDSDGSLTYIHDGSETSSDTFTYKANDGSKDSNVATVSIVISPTNDAPSADDDNETTDEDVPVTIDVLLNDSDPDGDRLSVDWVSRPTNGSVTNNGSNVTYAPAPDFNGTDSFTYTASDGNGGTAKATVTVRVRPVNDPPIAQDDSAATNEDTPRTIPVLANDSDPDGDSLIVQAVTQPTHGSVTKSASDVTYTPAPGFNGADSFTYAISDSKGGTATATATVAVAMVNDPPIAQDDSAFTDEGIPVTIPVLLNDSDPDGDTLVIESMTKPLHGATVPSGASVVYTPSPRFDGTDTFTYTVSDGNGGTATATVFVTVVAANDPPAAQDDSATTNENTPLTIPVLANDSDPDADALVVESIVKSPATGFVINNGTDVTYIPDPGFVGVDFFTYAAADGKGKTATARVTVVVKAVNDPPVAQDDATVTDEGTLVSIPVLANDSDPDGDFLLVESFSQPQHGSVLNSRTGVSYIPDPGFRGVDTFSYTVTDGNGGTATAKVTVSVAVDNEPPVAQEDNAVTDEGIAVLIPVLLNDGDPNADPLTVVSVSSAENGRVLAVGTDIQYTPNAGFSGVDEFTYTVSDGRGGKDTASVLVAVVPVNDPPVAQNDSSTVAKDTPITISVLANDADPDGDSLIVESIDQPQNGTVDNNGTDIVYTPNAGFTGSDTFTYTVSDGRGSTDTATVTVGVSSRGGAGGAGAKVPCDGKVIISEVAWAGTAADSRDEWIELRNLGTAPVDLSGWVLRWRRTHPSTPDDQIWKVVELSGVLAPATIAECDRILQDTPPAVRIFKENPEDVLWFVGSVGDEMAGEYYLLERRHDATVSDVEADLIYDTSQALNLELSDLGEVIMLVNDAGEVVDTANASYLGRDGWAAGSAATRGTMERIDPLGPDTAENWNTNTGIVIHGIDAKSQLLRATPGEANAPVLESLAAYAKIEPTTARLGETLKAGFSLPRQDRRKSGWPWLNVTRPGFTGLVGAGGAADLTRYSFSGRYQSGDDYVLEIETANLTPGSYVFWIIYGQGKAILVPVVVTP